jgi:hypothetical protein
MDVDYIKKNAVPKKVYTFVVHARNVYGLGPKSDEAKISTGSRPDAPASINAFNPPLTGPKNFNKVDLTWGEPNDNGSPITGYVVKILKKNN